MEHKRFQKDSHNALKVKKSYFIQKDMSPFRKKVDRIILTPTVRKIIFNMSERRQFQIINKETTLLYGAVKLLSLIHI